MKLGEKMEGMNELHMVLRVLLAFLLGAIIGWEREHHSQSAGIRTCGAMAIGACVFGLISMYAPGVEDTTRVAAQVVTGVGFLGAGVIFRQGNNLNGLTTAATLWAVAAIGLATAFMMYTIAILTTILLFLLLTFSRMKWWRHISRKRTLSRDN